MRAPWFCYCFSLFLILHYYSTAAQQPFHNATANLSANRDYPVSSGAVLNFTATGELVLQDVDGSIVWTTNTNGKYVAGLNLTDDGNLVLFNMNRSVVWQTFDYPTDSLVRGQRLFPGQQLIPSVSSTNWTAQKGLFSLQVKDDGLYAYAGSKPPQLYNSITVYDNDTYKGKGYVSFLNGNLSFFIHSRASSGQYMKLTPDRHLQVFEWQGSWLVVADLLDGVFGQCNYPLACGRNALCSGNQQCSCPLSSSPSINYFRAVNNRQPNLGCSTITPLTCNATQDQVLIALENVMYFSMLEDIWNTDIQTCKQACVNNCSCKAALFQYGSDILSGGCYLPSELYTMMNVDPDVVHRNASAFIKVQNVRSPPSASKYRSNFGVILSSSIGSVLILLGVISFVIYIIRKRRWDAQMEEESIGEIPGMPTRFSYEELKTATEIFNKKLGQGGFGAVFEGTLKDGSKIAVKCLEGLGQVKPQNILLASYFNAKVSDFGLSKLIDRDQPQVMTTMRGTPGYLAPEWLSSVITEKVDVYSFGIVLLEMLCGRKKVDRSKSEESWHLLAVLQKCWEHGTLQDMVDKYSEEMQTHSSEVVEMMKLASWCLQCDFKKRPSMSVVVKVLEGVMEWNLGWITTSQILECKTQQQLNMRKI